MLDWAFGRGLLLMNICFQKRKIWLITFRSGETETMIDYILVNSNYRSSVKYVKLILGKIQIEIKTVEADRIRGERRVC